MRFNAAKLQVKHCQACNACFSKDGACVMNDDFNSVARELEQADGIVIAAPVYWYTFPAAVKAIIDKFYAFCVAEKSFAGKKCALITCCEESTAETFTGINFAFDRTFSLVGAEVVGKVEIPAVNGAGEIKNTDGEAQAARLADLFI